MVKDLNETRYVSLTSYKQDGAPVSTPVWLVAFEDGYFIITEAGSFKVKRLRRNPIVTLRVAIIRGRVRAGELAHHGVAELLTEEQSRGVGALMRTKYPLGWFFAIQLGEVVRRLCRKPAPQDVVIKVVVSQ